ARTARRHRVLSRGRRRVHRGGARALPRGPAGCPGRGAARAMGRKDRAARRRRDRPDRATGRGAAADVARSAVVRRAHLGVVGPALEAQAGSFHVVLDPASGAIRSLTTGDRVERVRPAGWPGGGLNQLLYVQGGAHSALWTGRARDELRTAPDLTVSQAELVSARRERLPGIGARLVVERKLQ